MSLSRACLRRCVSTVFSETRPSNAVLRVGRHWGVENTAAVANIVPRRDVGVAASHVLISFGPGLQDDAKQEITAMPGQFRWGVKRLAEALSEPVADGLQSVIIFGVLGVSLGLVACAAKTDVKNEPVVLSTAQLRLGSPVVSLTGE